MKLKVEYIPIDDIKPYEKNAKIHTPEQIEQIKKSIEEFGMNDPIGIWKDNIIIEGHGRLMALKELGYEEVPVIRLDNLTDDQRRAYTLIHNQTTMNTGFDLDILNEELQSIDLDMSYYGFEEIEEPEIDIKDDDFDIDEIEDAIPEPKSKLGEIYQLGNHRLMCGDSTSDDDVNKLMNGIKADMVFTDPPYNVNIESRSKKNGNDKIKNDNLEESEFENFIDDVFNNMYKYTKENAPFYIWHNYKCSYIFEKKLRENNFIIKNQIIWVKDIPAYSDTLYRQQHENCFVASKKNNKIITIKQEYEPCFYCKKDGYDIYLEEGKNSSVWNVPSIQSAKSIDEYGNSWFKGGAKNLNLHVTQKPIILSAKAMIFNTKENDNVLDLFGGSGSTLISCEQLKRNCYIMEYDPKYVDVIIQRWENFTGRKAVLLND